MVRYLGQSINNQSSQSSQGFFKSQMN